MNNRILIKCPKCGRILGDTDKSIDCVLNCPTCKAVNVKIKVVKPYEDILDEPE